MADIEAIKTAPLKQLFVGYSEGNVVQFGADGNVAVSRSELRRFLIADQTRRAVGQAA